MKRTILWGIIFAVGLILLPFVYPSMFLINLLTQILIMGLFATSLNLLVGYTGMVSFGHAAFFGVGAYTAGIILQKYSSSVVFALGTNVEIFHRRAIRRPDPSVMLHWRRTVEHDWCK